MLKRIFKEIRTWWVWLTSKKVRAAINNGAAYEEVEKIVKEEVYGRS